MMKIRHLLTDKHQFLTSRHITTSFEKAVKISNEEKEQYKDEEADEIWEVDGEIYNEDLGIWQYNIVAEYHRGIDF